MRFKREVLSLLVSLLLVSLLPIFFPQTAINRESAVQGVGQTGIEQVVEHTMLAGIPHGPIFIDGNDQFTAIAEGEEWAGNGSESSPYIIEGFDFDLGGTNGKAIEIRDTTVHFIIRDCSFTGATGSGGSGIYLFNVANCEISDNLLYNNYNGLNLDADNATIVNNDIDAIAMGSGIYIGGMKNSLVSENTVNGGYVGFSFWGLDQCVVSQNTITNSEYLAYFTSSDNATFSDNEFINGNLVGIYLELSDNCTFVGNTIRHCGNGIFLDMCYDNSFKECTMERNTNGIFFQSSRKNVVEFCGIQHNVERGIILDSSATRNLFKWNIFLNNSYGSALCDGIVNIFDYNYYDYYIGTDADNDGIGDIPHPIPGLADSADYHPLLLEPTYPVWNPAPLNQELEFGNRFSYTLEISSPVPIVNWHISDTAHFRIDDTGTIMDLDVLDVGTYPMDLVVTNTHDLSAEGSFTITVEDTVSPVWVSQIQDRTYSFGEDIEIQLIAWDLAGIDNWDISDSENFSFTSTSFAETGIVTIGDIGVLPAGSYPLTITAYDPSGNYVTASLAITVTASDAPTGAMDFESLVSTGGLALGLVALIIALVAFANTRRGS
ncbi:MAG: nitrous oxide reductase family maturation protein NosD [Candidatus Hodarchaeota archaeon]